MLIDSNMTIEVRLDFYDMNEAIRVATTKAGAIFYQRLLRDGTSLPHSARFTIVEQFYLMDPPHGQGSWVCRFKVEEDA